jgi:hypothetical protein
MPYYPEVGLACPRLVSSGLGQPPPMQATYITLEVLTYSLCGTLSPFMIVPPILYLLPYGSFFHAPAMHASDLDPTLNNP